MLHAFLVEDAHVAVHAADEEYVFQIANEVDIEAGLVVRLWKPWTLGYLTLDVVVLVEHFVLLGDEVVHCFFRDEEANVAYVLLVVSNSGFLRLFILGNAICIQYNH